MPRASSTRFVARQFAGMWGAWLAIAAPVRADGFAPATDLRDNAGSRAVSSPAAHAAGATGAGYHAPAECPSRDAWNAALQARLPASLRAEDLTPLLSIEIQRDRASAARTHAYVGVIDASGAQLGPEARTVRGSSCAELVAALTLIAALGIERAGSSARGAATTEVSEAADVGDAASGWELSREQAWALSEDGAQRAPVPVHEEGARLGLAAFLLTETTAAPQPGWNYGLGASAHWNSANWQPWFLLGVYAGGGERARVPGVPASARFERLSTHTVGCPLRFPRSAPLALRPCIDLDLGRLSGEGLDVSRARQRSALWLSTGLELRVEWSPWHALALSGMLGGVLPLSRPRFYFRPQLTAWEVAPLGFRAGALANLSF
jgi:hypothetical protein